MVVSHEWLHGEHDIFHIGLAGGLPNFFLLRFESLATKQRPVLTEWPSQPEALWG